MSDITRVRGPYAGRNSGTAFNGMGWAVASRSVEILAFSDFSRTSVSRGRARPP